MSEGVLIRPSPANAGFLQGGGAMGALIRAKDWSQTPLGPPEAWPQSLRTVVSLCLASNVPINIVWGPGHTQIYNDGYSACCGDAHPRALGEDYRLTWASAWPAIGECFERAFAGETMFLENRRMFLPRLPGGGLEETFLTFSHSPIRDESGGVGGLFHPVTETTATMLAERRTRALHDLAASLGLAGNEEEVAERTVAVLSRFEFDLPFLLFYRLHGEDAYRLAARHGLRPASPASPSSVGSGAAFPWPFAAALATSRIAEAGGAAVLLRGEACGAYPEPPRSAFVLPMVVPGAARAPAVVVAGVSARLPMDENYRSFYRLLGVTISNALAAIWAREDERRRAEALAEIDRAKTAFFSNVSHEFRTPLTLVLGPLEEALARSTVAGEERRQLTVAHRNGLRLLRLVNALLDFSQVEAGRAQARFEATDLAALTAELASNFRSACERAGLALVVDCPPLPGPVHVNRDMWEKIVLNLLSNAVKFTFDGAIGVALRAEGGQAVLTVRDTGAGIPDSELPRVFERFHRVENARGRTHEGMGIGLALVREQARLHGGTAEVESGLGQGTVFTVRVPIGTARLPAERAGAARAPAPTATRAEAFVEEALRWLPDGEPAARAEMALEAALHPGEGAGRPRVLLADDNADMRDYIRRLLQDSYEVEAVADGQAALHALEARRPDLLLADVMMPRLDGFGLLRAVRSRPAVHDLPVVLLSARAGEESEVEGLEAGADDYLVKPFSARELVVRVAANLKMARVRQQAAGAVRASEERFRALVNASSYAVYRMGPDWTELRQLDGRGFLADSGGPSGAWLAEYIHPDDQARVRAAIRRAIRAKGMFELEHRVRRADGSFGWTLSRAVPLLDEAGGIKEWFGAASDITARREAEEAMRASEARLRALMEGVPQMVWRAAGGGGWSWASPQWTAYTGQAERESHGHGWLEAVHPEDRGAFLSAWGDAQEHGALRVEHRLHHAGERRHRWVQSQAMPVRNGAGRIVEWLGTSTDVENLRRHQEERILIAELQHRSRNLLTVVSAIAERTLAASTSLDEFGARFDRRLAALGRVQGLLSRGMEPGVMVDELLRLELAAHGVDEADARRVQFGGPPVVLPAHAVQLLALALHELMTNAVKHGALGREHGRLRIAWQERCAPPGGAGTRLRLEWEESGVVPAVGASTARRGFGLDLIEFALPYELDGETRLQFAEDGVRCVIELPLGGPPPDAAGP